jgi:hypothetical protein
MCATVARPAGAESGYAEQMGKIKRLLRAVFTKSEKPMYFEIELTDRAGIVLAR